MIGENLHWLARIYCKKSRYDQEAAKKIELALNFFKSLIYKYMFKTYGETARLKELVVEIREGELFRKRESEQVIYDNFYNLYFCVGYDPCFEVKHIGYRIEIFVPEKIIDDMPESYEYEAFISDLHFEQVYSLGIFLGYTFHTFLRAIGCRAGQSGLTKEPINIFRQYENSKFLKRLTSATIDIIIDDDSLEIIKNWMWRPLEPKDKYTLHAFYKSRGLIEIQSNSPLRAVMICSNGKYVDRKFFTANSSLFSCDYYYPRNWDELIIICNNGPMFLINMEDVVEEKYFYMDRKRHCCTWFKNNNPHWHKIENQAEKSSQEMEMNNASRDPKTVELGAEMKKKVLEILKPPVKEWKPLTILDKETFMAEIMEMANEDSEEEEETHKSSGFFPNNQWKSRWASKKSQSGAYPKETYVYEFVEEDSNDETEVESYFDANQIQEDNEVWNNQGSSSKNEDMMENVYSGTFKKMYCLSNSLMKEEDMTKRPSYELEKVTNGDLSKMEMENSTVKKKNMCSWFDEDEEDDVNTWFT